MKLEYKVNEKNNLISINEILEKEFHLSTRLKTKLIQNNLIYLNGKPCDTRGNANKNDIISINLGYEEESLNIVPTKMDLSIIYEDEWLLAVNKPAGIAVHPSLLHYETSLSNGVKYYFNKIGLKKKIRPVNRLDRNTSWIVVFAKCEYIQECLILQMQDNIFKKEYLALVEGI